MDLRDDAQKRRQFPRLDCLYAKWSAPVVITMSLTSKPEHQQLVKMETESTAVVKSETKGKKGKEDSKHVKVKIPAEILAKADPILQQALETLMYTNTVCTARLSGAQPLEEAAQTCAGVYIPQLFPSCIGSSKSPKLAWTLFGQGYVRCAGGDTREDAQLEAYLLALKMFLSSDMPLRIYNFSVQNNVSAGKLPYELNPKRLHEMDKLKYNYEPATFPGVYFKYNKKQELTKEEITLCTVQAFTSGKLNFVGAPSASTSIHVMCDLEPNVLRKCRVYTYDWSHLGIDIEALWERDNVPETRHPRVLWVVQELRESKEKSQKSQAARRTRKAELTIAKERRKALDRNVRKRIGKKSQTESTALVIVKKEEDDDEPPAKRRRLEDKDVSELRIVSEKIQELEDETNRDNGDDKKLLVYKLQAQSKAFQVEVTFGGIINVLDASSPEEDEEAQTAMRWVIAGGNSGRSPTGSASDMDSADE